MPSPAFPFLPTPGLRANAAHWRTETVENAQVDRLLRHALPSEEAVEALGVSSYGVSTSKWVGGKRALIDVYKPLWPASLGDRIFIDPGMGSNSVFFSLLPRIRTAVLADVNPALVNATLVVKYCFDELAVELERLVNLYNSAASADASDALSGKSLKTREVYEAIRDIQRARGNAFGVHPEDAYAIDSMRRSPTLAPSEAAIQDAAIFFMLIWLCFNGLWRVNRSGEMNTPHDGSKKAIALDRKLISLKMASAGLNSIPTDIRLISDFTAMTETILALSNGPRKETRRKVVVYFDPPYFPLVGKEEEEASESSGKASKKAKSFTSYAKEDFGPADHTRIKLWLDYLNDTINGAYDPPDSVKAVDGWAAFSKAQSDKARFLWMLSNSAAPECYSLFRDYDITTVQAPRRVNRDADGRGLVDEIVVRSYR